MICVNKSDKAFKYLMETFKVSDDTLAEIIYRYYEQTGSEDVFPSDVYIQAQLGQMEYVDTNPSARTVWDKWYSKAQRFKSDSDFQKAKTRALTFFPANAVKEYTDNQGQRVLSVEKPVEKLDIKHRKNFNSRQAYNDYLLVMGEAVPLDQRDPEERVIGPQPFTFKDGTTVTVPFKPNEQQEEALNAMNDFIKGNDTTMTLSGYAGTGKTSLMEIIAAKAKKEGKRIVFSASTNKAAAVLRDRVKSQGFTAQTLNKVFGIQVTPDEDKPYDANNLVVLLREADIRPGTIVVIDEASMINEENYRILNNIAKENSLKIIYVGDKGQLVPVKESQVSKVFRNNNGKVVTLTKVERTDDNAILREATNVRSGQPLSMESSFNEQGKGVAYVKKSNKAQIKQIVETFVLFLRQNPDYFRILAYTNKAVARYNEAVRNTLGYTDNTPRVGEPIVGYNNWGSQYDRRTKQTTYRFINSESYKVTEVGQPVTLRKSLDNGTSVSLQALPITLEDAMGHRDTFNFIDIKGNQQNRQAATILAREKARLYDRAKRLRGMAYAMIKGQINDLEQFLFINDDIKEGTRTLQKKYFDFGYAMTVHKSQGSTFRHVLMDDADIAIAENSQNRWESMSFGEEIALPQEGNFDAYDMAVAESGNLFDMAEQPAVSSAPPITTPPASEGNTVNMRQQLEYVAVSRATDTVTVIANDMNVRKEDSPLNHIKRTNPANTGTTTEAPKVVGENISSTGSEFAKKLTNPGNNLQVEYKGKVFRNAEHAYQTWKSGEFDEVAYNSTAFKPKGSKPVNKQTNYQTMVDILKAKLQQHPELVEGITQRGGEAYLKASTHKVTGDKYWESTGQNKFIEALIEAYNTINKLSISSISDKTEAYRVEISSGSQEFWKKVNSGWQTQHPQGLVAYRKHGDSSKTFSAKTVKEGWIGNPFSTQTRGENTVQQFYDWLVTGDNFGNERATEEFRQAIIQKILNTPEGSPILYYTELNRPSHATVIGFLVSNKHLLSTINQGDNRSNNNQINYGNDFRRVQERVRKDSQGASVVRRDIGQDARRRLARITKLELDSHTSHERNSKWIGISSKGVQYNIIGEIPAQLFHDIFEVVRYYTENGELVDLHEDYSDCKCYLSEDGTCGFAIEPNGNLVSVFNLGLNRGFLSAIKDIVVAEGATHLDAFDSNVQPLRTIYEHTLGAKVASSMDYNMEYDHDNIAANHGNPQVVFMVMGDAAQGEVTERHFNKDQYDEAVEYQRSYLQQRPLEGDTESFTPHTLQLRNYGIETGNPIPVVDAAWKIPLLQDLDSQLTTDNPDNERIIGQMNRILQSATEEDFLQSPTPERKEVNEKMTDYERRNTQMNNLMDNTVGLTASEVKEIAEDIVNSISDIITEVQADPGKVRQYFPTIQPRIDLSKASRKEIVTTIGLDNFIAEAKKRFENLRYDETDGEVFDLYDNPELLDQADLILDNWETVMELAADIFVINEGFSIRRNTSRQVFEAEEREFTGYDYDNYADPQDEDAILEERDEQEHWQVVARTIDAFNSMSDLVKLAIHECYELDRNGNKVLGKFGIPKRVNKVTAVNNILRWTQGTLDLNEMVTRLEEKASKKPWVTQLTRRLRDTSGKEADLQSQFYGVMHRHFQLYGIGQSEDGVYTSKVLNNHVALSEVMRGINAQFQMKNHQLFTSDGRVRVDSLNLLRQWYKPLYDLVRGHGISFSVGIGYTSKKPLSEEDVETAARNLTAASRMLGYPVSEETMLNIITEESLHKMWSKLGFIIDTLDKERTKPTKDYSPFDYDASNSIRSEVMGFLTPIVEEMEDNASNAFLDNGNMYQSYVIPSFLTQLFDQFHQPWEQFSRWADRFYGQSEWFRGKDGNWKLSWLDTMMNDPKAREVFNHKVQLNFNKHDYMRNMTPEEFTLSVFMEYFSERLDMKSLDQTPAWFRVPIQSNKPSSEFIRFYADRSPAYKGNIVSKMYDMFIQELSRIDTVGKRNRKDGEDDAISYFDEQGRRFQFLPWLNAFLMDNGKPVSEGTAPLFHNADGTPDAQKAAELRHLLNKKVDAVSKLTDQEEARLGTLVQEATRNFMQMRADAILNRWEQTGILKAAERVKGIKSLEHSVRENLENFLWNDFFAANQILQLTIVDKAFYPNATELQKRLAELHAPGTRGNKFATDYEGNRVSDGNYRTILIGDYKGFTASIIDNIAEVFDRKIAAAPESEKAGLKALKESLVGEDGAYRRINVTDGQAYSSPSSYRKKAFMFGKWSKRAEDIYQRLRNGDFSLSDLEVAFQPMKPFVYGHVNKEIGIEGVTPITRMPVPFQAKNSEYLLIMADALTRGQETGRPNLLKAIFDIMEESERLYPTRGIDTVQFDSAIKSGAQGVIDIAQFAETPGGEDGAYTLMRRLVFQEDDAEDGTKYRYDSYVHKTDYDNYAIQQEVPAHFREHQQAEGSQQRMNIPADLDFYNYDGGENLYSWKDPDGTEHSLNARDFRREYERVHAANIEDSFNTLVKELHLDSTDKKARNIALSEILQNEIMSSPRYGIDLFQACQIDPATGEFRIPKGDPIQAKRIEQLINSIIKNRVNKQKISGGPIVQATNFGTSRQLHIRFNDKNGNLLKTKEEYEKEHQAGRRVRNEGLAAKWEQETNRGLLGDALSKVTRPDGTLREAQEQGTQPQESVSRRNSEDTAAIEKLAKEQGKWIDETADYLTGLYGKRIGKGAESFVYRKDDNTVIKTRTIDPNVDGSYKTVQEALESMVIHNILFPETAMKVVAFGKDGGELNVVFEQPYIEGRYATTEEVGNFVAKRLKGEKDDTVAGGQSYRNSDFLLQDLKPANVIVDSEGNLKVIDGDFYVQPSAMPQQESYQEYVRKNQAGIAYFEVFAPIGMKKLFDKFKNPDGSINIEAVERCDPELLKVITGRIPNEDKYSIAHAKIVGFMPALAGDAIMFPYELTEIDDSDFDVDKRYTMQKVIDIMEDRGKIEKRLFQIASDSYKRTHDGKIGYEMRKRLDDAIGMLLDNPERMRTADKLSGSLYSEYQRILREEYPYRTKYPKKGTRDANNNQIIDMSWAVMSNEMTADKVLNPGGFEIPKHQAYVITAYRNSGGAYSWERLEHMSTKELQKLSASEKDLAWFDTNVQFYKQNAAGSNLIGAFAVNKVAHATLEGDGIFINVTDFCGDSPFTICDMEFYGRMPLDTTKDTEGQLIGKNIGSGVGASADTAKDPWLDMININMTTVGMFNALMRMGMPMEDAELFMAQDVILRMLNEFNRKSLEGERTSLDGIIQEKLNAVRKKNHYTEDSEINSQPLTRKELKEGLVPVSGSMSDERETIEYKTLLAFSKVKTLAKAIRKPTLVTRLNSISSAVGPLIIDNLILDHKLQQFLQVKQDASTGFYSRNPDGTFSPVDMDDILYNHPILKQFSRPVDSRNPDCPTQIMFGDMPAGSQSFKAVLKALPQNIADRIYDDRQLLSKLSDFFQSYLLVASGVVRAEDLKDSIEHFPEVFVGKGKDADGNPYKSVKEQYPDNAFIQAIQLNYDRKSGRAFLNINTTGMKEQEKERLRMAWTDLHKVNPELSTQLFQYAFFRGGIGFSPKTWMGLVPTYVKEHINGYVDTYRHFPRTIPDVVIEQFVRNNWDNATLAPRKGGEGTSYEVNLDGGTLLVRNEKDLKDLQGIKYMRTVYNKETYLWKLLDGESENKGSRFYRRIYPLGNNGEYVEMSTEANKEAISKTVQVTDTTETQELPATSPSEGENAHVETPASQPMSDSEQSSNVSDIIRWITQQNRVSTQEAEDHFEKLRERTKGGTTASSGLKKYFVNLFKQAGLSLDPDAALDKFREFC